MKTYRILGAIFLVFGFIFTLLGILSSVVPMIENEHFQLILNSFQETSADALTNALNAVVRFCLHSGYFFLFCGISLMIVGGMIASSANRKQKADAGNPDAHPASKPAKETSGNPKPAYYPGGLAPPVIALLPDDEDDEIPAPKITSTMSPKKTSPISGGVEPAVALDESDAQKLMHHDELLASVEEPAVMPAEPDYTSYTSNTAPAVDQTNAAPSVSAEAKKPRIVSTMGKRRG